MTLQFVISMSSAFRTEAAFVRLCCQNPRRQPCAYSTQFKLRAMSAHPLPTQFILAGLPMSKRDTFAISTTSSRTISAEHCPTCDGTNSIARGSDRIPCPTCSPTGQRSGLHVPDLNHGHVRPSHMWRLAMLFVGAALIFGVIALWAIGSDAWRDLF